MTVPASTQVFRSQSGASTDPISQRITGDGPITTSQLYQQMLVYWDIVHDLWGGTDAMRRAGKTYLFKEEAESEVKYQQRLKRSVLFNAFKMAVHDLVGKPFCKLIKFNENVPQWAKDIIEYADYSGRHIDIFWKDVFRDALRDGVQYVMVEYPEADDVTTLGQQQARKIQPYFCQINPRNVLGWRSETVDGKEVLTQIRIKEIVTKPVGDWDEKSMVQVRVLELIDPLPPAAGQSPTAPGKQVKWSIWREVVDQDAATRKTGSAKDKERTWEMVKFGILKGAKGKPISRIPIVPVYTGYESYFVAKPPLIDLAYLNIAHWQSDSDQRNVGHFTRVPILAAYGWPTDDAGKKAKVTFEGGGVFKFANPSAKMEWVEHTGAAMAEGRNDLTQLVSNMARYVRKLLEKKPAAMTATENILDGISEDSELGAMVRGAEDALEQCFDIASAYVDGATEGQVEAEINKDFGISLQENDELDLIQSMAAAGQISEQTLISEMKRRNILADSVTYADEKAKLEAQGPTMAQLLAQGATAPKKKPGAPGAGGGGGNA